METQWLDGPFCKWQIFRTPSDYATTNSNIESFNSVIKRDFTNRKRQSIMSAINIIEEIITYYSTHGLNFSVAPRYNYKLNKNKFIYTKNNKNRVSYVGKNNKHEINMKDKTAYKYHSCNFKGYLKFSICMHFVAFSNNFNLDLYDPKYKADQEEEKFEYKSKRGRRKLAEKALVNDKKIKKKTNV
jgi:hypothetical protein